MLKTGLAVGVLLIAVVLPAQHALASAPTEDGNGASEVGKDFGEFWWTALARLEQTPPDYEISRRHKMLFQGLDGMTRAAWCAVPSGQAACAVLHITDAEVCEAVEEVPGCAQFVFAWREDIKVGAESVADARQHVLYRAVIDTCRLTQILSGMGSVRDNSIGLVGEGYGAGIAMAVAALMPAKVQFVIAHQPICLSVASDAGEGADASQAKRLRALRRTATRLSARSFAPFVRARSLVTVGMQDQYATPETILDLYTALPGEKFLWQLEGVGHCAARETPHWNQAWRAWAFGGQPPA